MTVVLQGKNEAARLEHNKRAWLVWHIAALQRAKRMPSLKSMMARKRPPPQSLEQQQAIMRHWADARNKRVNNG